MSDKTILELLNSRALVETMQIKLSPQDLIEYEAACEVQRVKPSTHARNMMVAFAREIAAKYPAEFQLKLAGTKDAFIDRKKRVAKKNEARFIKAPTKKKKPAA